MISSAQELKLVKKVFEEIKADLRQEGIAFDEATELGIMIEVPSAAICADSLIKEADFFSIGTNDLVQYTLAVDRGNDKVADYYDFFNPAVLRLVKMTIDASRKVGKSTSMCGESAGDPLATLLLLGLGLDGFSMSAAVLPKIKKIILESDMRFAKEAALAAMEMESSEEVRKLLKGKLEEMGLDYLILL
jgi:phosphotransferase system enzyme I (PtsI)